MAYRPYIWRKLNPEQRKIQKRREKTRRKLRDMGILPPHGEPMNEEQEKIYNLIGNDDYSFLNKKTSFHSGGKQITVELARPEYLIWYRAKSNAKEGNYDFNITPEDIIIPDKCPLLGIELSTDPSMNHNDSYYTIDRIDSSKGYIKGNIQIISYLANTMKNNASKEQLVTFAKNILSNL
jgi:hypothetical protein